MSRRYEEMFATLDAKGELAWIPFLMLGYPSIEQSVSDIQAMIDSGADALELGIPFSDPVADGPVIQLACERALKHGTSLRQVMAMVKEKISFSSSITSSVSRRQVLRFRPF